MKSSLGSVEREKNVPRKTGASVERRSSRRDLRRDGLAASADCTLRGKYKSSMSDNLPVILSLASLSMAAPPDFAIAIIFPTFFFQFFKTSSYSCSYLLFVVNQ